MLTLGPLAFAAPLALLGLLLLPVLWRLLRATPPPPKRAVFPPLRLLKDAPDDAETPHHAPWWLIVFRLGLAALVILALAQPVWRPGAPEDADRPLLLVIDDGWASAPGWREMRREGERRLGQAQSAGRLAALAFTAPDGTGGAGIRLSSAADARRRLDAAEPRPWPAARAAAAERIAAAQAAGDLPPGLTVVWISDGLDGPGTRELARVLNGLGDVTALTPPAARGALALGPPQPTAEGFTVPVLRAPTADTRAAAVVALGDDGRALARANTAFEPRSDRAEARLQLPLDLRNRVAAVRIEGAASAGAVQLTDDAWRRPRVGVIDAPGEDGQPLLSDLHYVQRAMEPHAELWRESLDTLIEADLSALVMVDAARVEDARIAAFVEDGGVLIRFAGPRLAARGDSLTPVRLREGGRLFGGALAWDEPQRLAPFADDSPFAGLQPDPEAAVRRQVLAEPGTATAERVWARLSDGTPLVTAERRGRGWIVLFHVTAGPDWSDLPLTGLYPQMLRRVLGLARGAAPAANGGAWSIETALDASGRLTDPPATARPVPAEAWDAARPGPRSPAGLWRVGAAAAALNLIGDGDTLTALPVDLPGVRVEGMDGVRELRFAGPFLAIALVLLALDALVALMLAGRLPRLPAWRGGGAAAALALGLIVLPAPDAGAQTGDDFAMRAALEVRFAFIRTGDSAIDARSAAGLRGLSAEVTRRSAIEPEEAMGVDVERDEILFFPLIYWPVTPDAPALSPVAAARVSAYLQSGGLILFDTQDAGAEAARAGGAHPGLARLLDSVDVPPLALVPPDHVLTRSFYLLQDFPGRWSGGRVWVEADPDGASRDGTSGVVIGAADWAAAWAIDERGQPLSPVEGGERQREMARRFGVNLAMYAMTGNYKADQVHVPALLERLGQ
ncbi:MAG: DUF4159 domain-containing protein [Maricaulaceae bacterium]|nr:DUF4159 domain-containing protein [Maricaulaceae bacterium]